MAYASEAILEKILELSADVEALSVQVANQDKVITGMKHYLKVAADYRNDDPAQVLGAIQAALGEAAKYEKTRRVKRKKRK